MTAVPRRSRPRGQLPEKKVLEHGSVMELPGQGITVTILGEPAPQGSKIVSQFGGMKESNVRTEGWRAAIARVCKQHLPKKWEPLDGPIVVDFWFFFTPPLKAKPGDMPTTRATNDWDKLGRALGDGLTDGGVIVDDARIVDGAIHKRYVWPGEGEPRAVAIVSPYRKGDPP